MSMTADELEDAIAQRFRDLSGMGDIRVGQAARECIRLMEWARREDGLVANENDPCDIGYPPLTLPPDHWTP